MAKKHHVPSRSVRQLGTVPKRLLLPGRARPRVAPALLLPGLLPPATGLMRRLELSRMITPCTVRHCQRPLALILTLDALNSADIALRPLIDEWVNTYISTANDEAAEKAAVHEIITFFVRCCGLNADIEEDEAMDADGVIDTLERIQDESVKVSLAIYPLIARTKESRTFRTNLDIFVPYLIKIISSTDVFYDDADSTKHSIVLLPLLLTWLHTMSSSPLRSIRHTSTHITLRINSALCEIASSVSNELSLQERKHAAEAKKAGSTAAAKKKVAVFEAKVKEVRAKKERVQEYMDEILDVYVVLISLARPRIDRQHVRTSCP